MSKKEELFDEWFLKEIQSDDKEMAVFSKYFFGKYFTWIVGSVVFIFGIFLGFKESDMFTSVHNFISTNQLLLIIYISLKIFFIFYLTIFVIGVIKYILKINKNVINIYKTLKADYENITTEMERLKKSVETQKNEVIKTNKVINREIVALQHGETGDLKSDIIIKLLQDEMPLSKFLIENLNFEQTPNLTNKILQEFKKAKNTKIAKACCVINNTKFIEVDNLNDENEIKMLRYFINHRLHTEDNLIISRVFSFAFEKADTEEYRLFVSREEYRYILYLYLIANYYSGVNTYVHLYSCTLNQENRCTKNDYVSLSYFISNKMNYIAFFSPSEFDDEESSATNDMESLITVEKDVMLAKALESDFKSKVKETVKAEEIDQEGSIDEFHFKIKPEKRDLIHIHLGINKTSDEIKHKLIEYVNVLKDNKLKDLYKEAIEQFFV